MLGKIEHFSKCPLHEDNPIEHECTSQNARMGVIEWDKGWYLALQRYGLSGYVIRTPIEYCPFCGDELPVVNCKCDEIAQGYHERNIGI